MHAAFSFNISLLQFNRQNHSFILKPLVQHLFQKCFCCVGNIG